MIRYVAAVAFLLAAPAIAQSNNKGANSPIALGPILAIADDKSSIVIRHDGAERRLDIGKKTRIEFVGMPKASQKLSVGYDVKGKMDKGVAKALLLTLPVGEPKSLGDDRVQLTLEQILVKADDNKDGGIDYVEMSTWIYRSPKHGPDHFGKADKNADGIVDLDELPKLMEKVSWWNFSRKTSSEWFTKSDKDTNGSVSMKEFAVIAGNHLENRFKRADLDKNSQLSQSEFEAYLSGMTGTAATRKSKR